MTNIVACVVSSVILVALGLVCIAPLQQALEYKNKFQGGLAIMVMIAHFVVAIYIFCRGMWGV